MRLKTFLPLIFLLVPLCAIFAQADGDVQLLQKVPLQYLKDIEKKISKYSNPVSNKTIKTFTKFSKKEVKIQFAKDQQGCLLSTVVCVGETACHIQDGI